MRLSQRLSKWITRRLASATPIRELLTSAGNAIRDAREAKADAKVDGLLQDEIHFQRLLLNQRMNEMLMIREAELACYQPEKALAMRESGKLGSSIDGVAQFKERLWELELALEDRGWVRETTLAALEFSRYGVQQLIRISRVYAIKNPIIKRGAEICSLYVFGRGVEIRSDDDSANETIQEFLEANSAELGHVGLALKEVSIQTDGSLYFGLATDTKGNVKLSNIEPLEIMDVIVDPDDPSKPLYFRRQWNRNELDQQTGMQSPKAMKCWYPSLWLAENPPTPKPASFGDEKINWDMPILRVKIGSPPAWRWGIPPLYAAIDWARAYKDFLEDWATVQRSLARFALVIETKGGAGTIAAYQALLNTTFANADGTQIERNPPPVVGSAHISGPDNKISSFKSSGVSTAPEQARRLLLQCAAALGLPETFFGDASTGSLATALSLDRPTELKFTEIQRRWIDTITQILRYVLNVGSQTAGSKMREARRKNPAPTPVAEMKIIVNFPNVVEHDINNMIEAITHIGTLGGRTGIACGIVDRRLLADRLLAEIGVENRDQLLDAMGYGEGYDPQADIEDQRTQVAPQQISGDGSQPSRSSPPEPAPTKEALLAAARKIRERGSAFAHRNGR